MRLPEFSDRDDGLVGASDHRTVFLLCVGRFSIDRGSDFCNQFGAQVSAG